MRRVFLVIDTLRRNARDRQRWRASLEDKVAAAAYLEAVTVVENAQDLREAEEILLLYVNAMNDLAKQCWRSAGDLHSVFTTRAKAFGIAAGTCRVAETNSS